MDVLSGFQPQSNFQESPKRISFPHQSFTSPSASMERPGQKRQYDEMQGGPEWVPTGANLIPVARVNFHQNNNIASEDLPLHERLRRLAEGNAANKNIVTLTSSSSKDRFERR